MKSQSRTLAGTEASLAASESRVALNQINPFLAVGGGWQNVPKVEMRSMAENH